MFSQSCSGVGAVGLYQRDRAAEISSGVYRSDKLTAKPAMSILRRGINKSASKSQASISAWKWGELQRESSVPKNGSLECAFLPSF